MTTNKPYIPPLPDLPIGTPQFHILPANSKTGERLMAGDWSNFVYDDYCTDEWARASTTPEGAIRRMYSDRAWGDRLVIEGTIESWLYTRYPSGANVYDVRYTRIVAYLLPGNDDETTVDALIAEYQRLTKESPCSP